MSKIDGGLRALFRKNIPEAHWQAIESWSTGSGTPDANYCLNGAEGWIEFKKADHWKVGISPEQIAWAERRTRAGGRVTFAVRRARDELWLLPAAGGRVAKERGLNALSTDLILGQWQGPRSWDWHEIKGLLRRGL